MFTHNQHAVGQGYSVPVFAMDLKLGDEFYRRDDNTGEYVCGTIIFDNPRHVNGEILFAFCSGPFGVVGHARFDGTAAFYLKPSD